MFLITGSNPVLTAQKKNKTMEECSYWEIHYVSCEGNNRWAVAKTPTDWNEYDTMSRIPLGGCGDDVAEIMEIIPTSDSNYSWDFC